MKKVLFTILFVLATAFNAWAISPVILDAMWTGTGLDVSSVTLWLNLEECDNTTPYTMGVNEYSAGDTTWDFNGGVAINGDSALLGSCGVDAVAQDWIQITDNLDNIVDVDTATSQGSLSFQFRVTTWVNQDRLFRVQNAAVTDLFMVRLISDNDLEVVWYENSGYPGDPLMTGNAHSTGIKYIVVYQWDQNANSQVLTTYLASDQSQVDTASSAAAIGDLGTMDGYLLFGSTGVGSDVHVDHLIISTKYSFDHLAAQAITNYPQ